MPGGSSSYLEHREARKYSRQLKIRKGSIADDVLTAAKAVQASRSDDRPWNNMRRYRIVDKAGNGVQPDWTYNRFDPQPAAT